MEDILLLDPAKSSDRLRPFSYSGAQLDVPDTVHFYEMDSKSHAGADRQTATRTPTAAELEERKSSDLAGRPSADLTGASNARKLTHQEREAQNVGWRSEVQEIPKQVGSLWVSWGWARSLAEREYSLNTVSDPSPWSSSPSVFAYSSALWTRQCARTSFAGTFTTADAPSSPHRSSQ